MQECSEITWIWNATISLFEQSGINELRPRFPGGFRNAESSGSLFWAAMVHRYLRLVSALMEHYGEISGLFVALWNSNKEPRPDDCEENREEY